MMTWQSGAQPFATYWMVALVFLGLPIIVIWSLNEMFRLDISLTLRTWFATWVLIVVLMLSW